MTLLFGLGIFGLLGVSILWPFLAILTKYFSGVHRRAQSAGQATTPSNVGLPLQVEIIIPVHNEESCIGSTLSSVLAAVQHLRAFPPDGLAPEINIRVGADRCTDRTALIAHQFEGVAVSEFMGTHSKWSTLKGLCMKSKADWLVLLDAGTLWPQRFLVEVLEAIQKNSRVIAVAPAYRPMRSGWVHRLLWHVEVGLKRMEASCGGPVSLHGATVCYKTALLKNAFASLGTLHWLNDDVAIPLTLRALDPQGVILYPVGVVYDAGIRPHEIDLGRRKRILIGNLQWVRVLLVPCFRRNPVAGLISLRRLFRIFWAYWIAFLGLGVLWVLHGMALPLAATVTVLVAASASARQLAGAALVSLLAPFQMAALAPSLEASWE